VIISFSRHIEETSFRLSCVSDEWIDMHCLVVSHSSFIMTYRLVLNNRSIDNLTDQYLSGALKTELDYFRYRRIPIGRNRLRTATTSPDRPHAYQPKDVFYLFFENKEKASKALEKANAIPIISLVKYKPQPTVHTRPTPPRAAEPVVRAPPTIHLSQELVDIPRVALTRHLKSFINEVSSQSFSPLSLASRWHSHSF
jgi:hypothetical protein